MSRKSKDSKFASIANEILNLPDTQLGHGKKGFGQNALNVHGKIFAMLTPASEYVVKLPKKRVAGLVASGDGKFFEMANRQMKEWLALSEDSQMDWKQLAIEAYEFTRPKA
ncbi:hypothetical protein [Ottowia oryzae]